MHSLETLQSGGYKGAGLTRLKLTCPLATLPNEILELGDTLEELDLSGTGLSSLPANLGPALPKLTSALFSSCNFRVFPRELASCPSLETVAFRDNAMEELPEDALPPRLRSLVLTNNRLASLPAAIGRCDGLQECMLAGNQLRDLPPEMAHCKKLSLLRLSANRLSTLPRWLLALPELAFLSFASNPCCTSPTTNGLPTPRGLADIPWRDLEIQQTLASAPSSTTSQALWHQSPHYAEDVAVTLFCGTRPTDAGLPADELAACLAAGAHESLVTLLGRIHDHPDEDTASYQGGIAAQLLPLEYTPLASTLIPSSLEDHGRFPLPAALELLTGLASALAHLHARGIAHGSVSAAESILASRDDAHALLCGFGTATVYGLSPSRVSSSSSEEGEGGEEAGLVEKIEVLAFGRVVEGLLGAVDVQEGEEGVRGLRVLAERCVVPEVAARPGFGEVVDGLEALVGWRGMMRIPDVVPR